MDVGSKGSLHTLNKPPNWPGREIWVGGESDGAVWGGLLWLVIDVIDKAHTHTHTSGLNGSLNGRCANRHPKEHSPLSAPPLAGGERDAVSKSATSQTSTTEASTLRSDRTTTTRLGANPHRVGVTSHLWLVFSLLAQQELE